MCPKISRNGVLTFISVLFYAWGGLGHLALLLGSILINFLFVQGIRGKEQHARKWLIVGIVFNVLVLLFFKYRNFFLDLALTSDDLTRLVLPVGISFYTFHQLSMLVDLYKDRALPKPSFGNTVLYITLFPQLVAGPIVRYNFIADQLLHRKESLELLYKGIQLFIIGLAKKVIVANTLAVLADSIFDSNQDFLTSGTAWLGITAYTLQIYFDFSGYTDMALGLGNMFGFQLPENFNLPYIAKSMKDFWRRWHISLSTWFRDYVYIPLGGNKASKTRTYFNLIVVFALTGFWHGASWSFIFWGLFHGFFLLMERIWLEGVLNRIPKLIQWAYTLLVVMIGWVFFRVEEFSKAWYYVEEMFAFDTVGKSALFYLNREFILVLIFGFLFSVFSWKFLSKWRIMKHPAMEFLKNGALLVLFLYCTLKLTNSSYNPFIYFNF
jgi:alginate O-acetyltransferase complex protein AlgI